MSMKREDCGEEGRGTHGDNRRLSSRSADRARGGVSQIWLLSVIRTVPLLAIALLVSGTKACQEDYAVGSQVSRASVTATSTATNDSGGDDDGTGTATPVSTSDGRATPTVTATLTVTPTATAVATRGLNGPPSGSASSGLFQELSALSDRSPDRSGALARGGAATSQRQVADGNWLGRAFGGGSKGNSDTWSDSDNDGYDDRLEQQQGSRTDDSESVPTGVAVTQLDQRVELLDIEDRGVAQQGADADGDGLSDRFERAIGSDPKLVDSDGDGISDAREFDLGSDPVVAEPQREGEGR